MQVARLLEPRTDRTFVAKLRQAVRAIQLERALTKDEILTLYLGLAPYGGNLEGTRAASLAYFGKEPKRLSLGEAALLVAIPQSPEVRRPDRSAAAAHRARDRVLDRVALAGRFPLDEIAQAKTEPSPAARRADADACPARGGSGDRSRGRPQGHRAHHRRQRSRSRSRTSRASARMRSGRTSRWPSWRSTTRPAKCWRASPAPTISTSAAPARST